MDIIKQDKNLNCGAVACFTDNNGGAGHVAIVEEIDTDGNITCSSGAWQSTYFYITHLLVSENYNHSHFSFQGFIYNPYADQPIPPTFTKKRKKFPWVIFTRIIKERRTF